MIHFFLAVRSPVLHRFWYHETYFTLLSFLVSIVDLVFPTFPIFLLCRKHQISNFERICVCLPLIIHVPTRGWRFLKILPTCCGCFRALSVPRWDTPPLTLQSHDCLFVAILCVIIPACPDRLWYGTGHGSSMALQRYILSLVLTASKIHFRAVSSITAVHLATQDDLQPLPKRHYWLYSYRQTLRYEPCKFSIMKCVVILFEPVWKRVLKGSEACSQGIREQFTCTFPP